MDTIASPTEPPSFELQMIDFLRARYRQEVRGYRELPEFLPTWVPSALRITGAILPGDWPCTTTLFGVLHVAGSDSRTVVIDLFECEILAFRWNNKREIRLRELAEKAATEVMP